MNPTKRLPTVFDQGHRALSTLGLGILRQASPELGDHTVAQYLGFYHLAIPAILEDVHNEFPVVRIRNLELKGAVLVDFGLLIRMPAL